MLKVVYDTNVVVSAVLKSESIPSSLLALALQDQVKLCLSPAIFDEYREVLNRPKFGLQSSAIEHLLREMRAHALLVRPTEPIANPLDEKDSLFLECAVATGAQYLVTGNIKHFPASPFRQTKIVTPSAFAVYFFAS